MPVEYAILTPEKVAVKYPLAGIGSRVGAYLIDTIAMGILIYAVSMLTLLIAFVSPGMGMLVMAVLTLVIFLGYHILLEALWNGQTLGKKAFGIRVKMADGSPVTPGAAFLRNILRLGDMLPSFYTLGLMAMFFTEKSQRLGDLAANTIVVRERRNVDPVPLSTALTEAEHPLEELVGDLRGMTIEEYLAVKTLCDRYPDMPSNVQQKLLKEVWLPVANRHGIGSYMDVHPVYLMEATVMKYARRHGLL